MLQAIPSFFLLNIEKSVYFFLQHLQKHIVSNNYCVAFYNDKMFFMSNCKINNILLGNAGELLRKWIYFALSIYTWTVCIHFSSIDSVETLLQRVEKCLITCNKQLTLITETREWTECRALPKRNFCGKNLKSVHTAPFKKPKQRKLVSQSLQKEFKKVKSLNLNWN